MSPLRFRAWHVQQKKMYSPEEMGADELTLAVDGRGLVNVSGQSTRLSQYLGEQMIVMQSTGLTDKNGKEIFEGDILHCVFFLRSKEKPAVEIGFVRWQERVAQFACIGRRADGQECGWPFLLGQSKIDFQVIGNVHHNPDLLPSPNAA